MTGFDKMFDFSNTQNMLETMTQSANTQAAAAKDLVASTLEQKKKVSESASQYNDAAQVALNKLNTTTAKGDEARRLAESGNVLDRITLVGEQIINPRDFTREGRQQQIAEQSQILAARGQVFNVENNLAVAKIDEAGAVYNAATAGANAKMNLMRAHVEGLQLMSAGMQATETMRQQNLSMADMPTIQQTMAAPLDPKLNGKISLNGMTYTPTELKERQNALETREKLAFMSPQAADPAFGQKIGILHDMQLATYSIPDLEQLKQNGYTMPDGTQVRPEIFDSHMQRQLTQQQQSFDQAMNQELMNNQVPMMLKEGQAFSKNVGIYATPGTPLAIANQNFLASADAVSKAAAADKTPQGKIRQVTAMNVAQKNLIDAVDKEATRKAGSDKDLAAIYRSQILGMPVQASQVEDVVRSRYIKGAGFGELLDNDTSNRIRNNADKLYADIKVEAAKNLDPMAVKFNDKQIREDAVNRAIEMERTNAGVKGINLIQKNVGNRTDSPAYKSGMVGGQVFEIQQRASNMAFDSVGAAEKLTPEKILALKNRNHKAVGISDEKASLILQRVNMESVMAEYDLFDKHKAGLGYEMQQWYANELPDMARTYTSNLPGVQQALTGDSVVTEAQKLASMYTMADESATDRGRKLATEISTGARKPENMWPVLLQNDKRLSDSQRQAIYYDVIMPAIQSARAKNANDEVATEAVYNALTHYKSDDSSMTGAIKTMMRELPTQLDNFNTMWVFALAQNQNSKPRISLLQRNPEAAGQQIRSIMPWMK